MTTERDRLVAALMSSKEYREAFWKENNTTGIAFQVREMRASRGWTQEQLGERAVNMNQVRIHEIENPDKGQRNVRTLERLALAFGVALEIRFISYGELIDRMLSRTPEMLSPPAIDDDLALQPVEQLPSSTQMERLLAENSTALEPLVGPQDLPDNVVPFPLIDQPNNTADLIQAVSTR